MRKRLPSRTVANEIESDFERVLEQIRHPKVVYLTDDIWAVWLDDDVDLVFVNLQQRVCSGHETFPCVHVEAIETERKRLSDLFGLSESEPIPDSDRLALMAIRKVVFEKAASNG